MNKKEFEHQLFNYMDVLLEDVAKKEVDECLDQVAEQMQQGVSEEEAMKSLGNPELVASNILKKHGIDFSKVNKKHGFIYQKFEQLFQVIHRLVDVMSKNDFKSNVKIVIDILILIVFVAILKIPFIVVQNLGDTLLSYISIPVLADVWSLIVDCIYIVVAVIVFINIFQKYFKNIKVERKEGIKAKGLESVSLEDLTKK